ncbi:sulfatase-like hydrolase/transferase, partial [Paenibacillus sepulcri]|nr:sulfatase-like hydrolase/transferase [Paenibacillus sepulcri]
MPAKPHIVIFNPDQWRADVMGHLGNIAAVTPNLDRLVQTDAVSFRNAFCQNPVCTPSRCSFMSGWYPHVGGHRTMFHMMQEDEPVLLKSLKDEGYTVWWGGKNDLVPAENGFEAYCDIKYQPEKKPRPETNLHFSDGWRGDPESDNYYSFYAGKLEKAPDEEAYYDGDWANVLGAIDFIRNAPQDKPLCIY